MKSLLVLALFSVVSVLIMGVSQAEAFEGLTVTK